MDKKANNIITYKSSSKLKKYIKIDGNKIVKHLFKNQSGVIEYENDIIQLDNFFFHFQRDLIEVEFPCSVKKIGDYVLSSCCNLKKFTLGKNVCCIGVNFLAHNLSLTELIVDDANATFDSRGGCNAIIETATNTMIRATKGTIMIPRSVERIARDAFDDKNCPSYIMVEDGNSVYDSRGNCNAIIETATNTLFLTTKSFSVFPQSVTHISEDAFIRETCPSHITVEEGNPVYDSRDNCDAIIETATDTLLMGFDNAFVPDDVTGIADNAFVFSGVTSINIPGSVRWIGEEAFATTDLESITIENGVERIGNGAFWGCPLKKITIPDSVVEIGEYAFCSCYDLSEVILGKNIKKIGEKAFAGTEYIEEFGNNRKLSVTVNSCTPPEIGDDVFSSLETINVPLAAKNKYVSVPNWLELSDKMGEYRMLDNLKNKKTEVQIVRLKVLDRCFRSSEGFTMKGLCEACGKTLADRGLMPMSSDTEYMKRTIYNDMKYIRETLKGDIEKCNGHGHQPHYRYADPNYSMFEKSKSALSTQGYDRREVGKALAVIQQFSDIRGFEQVKYVIDKLQEQLGIENNEFHPSVAFDVNLDSQGTKHIPTIQDAISAKQTLNVTYKDAGGKKINFTVHPYNLTQRDGCWYLICHKEGSEDKEDMITLELFRIEKLSKAKVKYNDIEFDVSDYLYNVMGVKIDDDITPIEITLRFSKEKFPFIENNPIHRTMTPIKTQPRTVTINVQPNDDFYKAMLELGSDVEVISPQPVRERMRELAQTVANMYK